MYKKVLWLAIPFFTLYSNENTTQKITVLGTGYVGLITGACLAECGHEIICADIDEQKIKNLQAGNITIYEPNLEQLIHKNYQEKRLFFTADCDYALQKSDIIFIAVGTPNNILNEPDLSYLMSAINCIAQNLNSYKIICIKSTVPIGTTQKIKEYLRSINIADAQYDLISNPEFLREGNGIADFFNPDRIIIGAHSLAAQHLLDVTYAIFKNKNVPFVYTDWHSAEIIKYASNAFLANKLSFINEIANLCDTIGGNITTIAYGLGLDKRIGMSFLKPGPGFGGSCFPKDCEALLYVAHKHKVDLLTVQATLKANEQQKRKAIEKLKKLIGTDLQNKTIAILGLAFKAHTDDIRCSPAITVIEEFKKEGAVIKAYDPIAQHNMQTLFPTILYGENVYDTVAQADACIIMTEWPEFAQLDLIKMHHLMKQPCVIDMRNILDGNTLLHIGFIFDNIGQHSIA